MTKQQMYDRLYGYEFVLTDEGDRLRTKLFNHEECYDITGVEDFTGIYVRILNDFASELEICMTMENDVRGSQALYQYVTYGWMFFLLAIVIIALTVLMFCAK